MPAYFDHAATTPLRFEAAEAMKPWWEGTFGNASGLHSVARAARRAVDEARELVASALGGEPGEVIFTSGGTEADNLAVTGASRAAGGAAVLCSAVEHEAVLLPTLATGGSTIPVGTDGVVDLDVLGRMLREAVESAEVPALVSVMLANNETGQIQPLAEIAALVRQLAPSALVHTDAVHAFSWLDVAEVAQVADLVSVSAHKFGGPQGVGALLVRAGARGRLAAGSLGGGQEGDLRPGTENVAGIVGMAAAAEATVEQRSDIVKRVGELRDRLADGLVALGAVETGVREGRVAGSCHVCFEGLQGEEVLVALDQRGVMASAGSACASGAMHPSHVLRAMGMSDERARSAVRFSLGRTTTDDDVDLALRAVREVVAALRA